MSKKRVEAAIRSAMEERGWSLKSICGLWPAYLRDTIVSPYFSCSPVRAARNGYFMIDGVIGVIYPRFETEWAKMHQKGPGDSGFAVTLHIANLSDLRGHLLIHNERMDRDVRSFCDGITSLLDQMPFDEKSLHLAVEQGELLGRPIDHFSGFSNRPKFYALKEFIARSSVTHH